MAAVTSVFTLAYVAELLNQHPDRIAETSLELEPEDGFIHVHGCNDKYTPAFTAKGIENLKELLEIHESSRESY
ncbi:hypothetical protein DFP90_101281 [Aestuariispira insulae]|uniref:Uncharacterized protein n=1 Tax=Aestuariispira insulae TaxID=1461337 RepID=A0A3D9HVH3_9PROT|nr:hypothetical protein DFP90_101281 [Aestuariispira insulae]